MKLRTLFAATTFLTGLPALAFTPLDTSRYQGFTSLSKGEICVVSQGLEGMIDGADYSKKDREKEAELCSFDTNSVGVCGKLFSTFPAVELFELEDGITKQAFEENNCAKKVGGKTDGEKIAKYKYSTSCSRTASILGYYHISRALGIKAVPQSVLRTMDMSDHKSVAKKVTDLPSIRNSSDVIASTWRSLKSALNSSSNAITTADGSFSYGALSVNPGGEHTAYAYYHGNGSEGVKNFRDRSPIYRNLKSSNPIEKIAGTELTTDNLSKIRYMKDAADMIVLDTIFDQKDRFGNTAAKDVYIYRDATGKLEKVTAKKVKKEIKKNGTEAEKDRLEVVSEMPKKWRKEVTARMKAQRALFDPYVERTYGPFARAEELLLKDNDCGLKNENHFRTYDLIGGINHINKETYIQVIKLYQAVREGQLDDFIRVDLAMSETKSAKYEIRQFKSGLELVAKTLNRKCHSGALKLDLNIKDHFNGTNNWSTTDCGPDLSQRPRTGDGLSIYTVVKSGINIRTEAVIEEGYVDTTKFIVDGETAQTERGDQVALIEFIQVGDHNLAKVRILESDFLPIGEEVLILGSALD